MKYCEILMGHLNGGIEFRSSMKKIVIFNHYLTLSRKRYIVIVECQYEIVCNLSSVAIVNNQDFEGRPLFNPLMTDLLWSTGVWLTNHLGNRHVGDKMFGQQTLG